MSVNPEFLREGTALKDFRKPPLTLVGHNHAADASGTIALYQAIDAPLVSTSIRVAEMIKYTSNTWHALKVCFANEIGTLCKRLEIDSHDVMDVFCRDEKLNLSPYYLKPGFAFGGSCLPKDVRALQYRAKEVDVDLPVISVDPAEQPAADSARLRPGRSTPGQQRIGLLGFSFKAGTDDLRESPIVILAEALLGKGRSLCIYDRNVSLARLVGANKEYIEQQIPHLSSLLCETIDEVIDGSEVIVVGNQVAGVRRGTHPDPRRIRSSSISCACRSRERSSRPTIAGSAGNGTRPSCERCSSATNTRRSIARGSRAGWDRFRPTPARSSSVKRPDAGGAESAARSSGSACGGSWM